jgi:hypothetical protein
VCFSLSLFIHSFNSFLFSFGVFLSSVVFCRPVIFSSIICCFLSQYFLFRLRFLSFIFPSSLPIYRSFSFFLALFFSHIYLFSFISVLSSVVSFHSFRTFTSSTNKCNWVSDILISAEWLLSSPDSCRGSTYAVVLVASSSLFLVFIAQSVYRRATDWTARVRFPTRAHWGKP